MQNRIKPFIILLLCLFTAGIAHGRESSSEKPEDIVARLQSRYDNVQSLTFNFHQDTRGEMTGRPRKGSGRAIFYRDDTVNNMRWDYTSPERQVLVSDGVLFSMYFSNLQQMILTPAENLDTDLTYSFFTGKGKLQKDFHIQPADKDFQSEGGGEFKIVKLIPKTSQSQVQDIHIWVTAASLIRRINIRDHFGTITVLNFSAIEVDSLTGMSAEELDKLFSFTPPEGTEIIRQ